MSGGEYHIDPLQFCIILQPLQFGHYQFLIELHLQVLRPVVDHIEGREVVINADLTVQRDELHRKRGTFEYRSRMRSGRPNEC